MQDSSGGPRPTITPERPIAGDPVEVGLRFTNYAKHAVVGASLVFHVPEDVTYIAGSARVNGHPVEGEPTVGIPLPVVKPGDNMDIRWSGTTELAIETDDPSIACTLTMPDGQRVPSESTALCIQRDAKLSGSSVLLDLVALADGGHSIVLTYALRNDGSRKASAVSVAVPIPAGCIHQGSSDKEAVSSPIDIPAQESCNVEMAFTLTPGDTRTSFTFEAAEILEGTMVAGIAPGGSIALPKTTALGDITFTITPDTDVSAGSIIQAAFSVTNQGLRAAENLTASFTLPEGIEFIAQSLLLNGRPMPSTGEGHTRALLIARLAPGSIARVAFSAVVRAVPSADTVLLRASCSEHEVEAALSLQPFVEFAADQNYIEASDVSGAAQDVLPFSVVVTNTGASASRVHLRAECDRVAWDLESGITAGIRFDPVQKKLSVTADIGEVLPGEQRRIGARVKLPWRFSESDTFEIPVYIQGDPLPESLLSRHVVAGRTNVSFRGSSSGILSQETLRRGHDVPVSFEIRNTGTTIARDVVIEMVMPHDLEIVSVHDGLFEGSTIHLGDIAPGAVIGLVAAVRFNGECDGGEVRTIRSRVRAQRSEVYMLQSQDIAVRADAVIGEQRVSVISIGNNLFEVNAHLRNLGDGIAREIWLQTNDLSGYLAGSTTVQGRAIRDVGPEPLLLRKLVLDRINPGQAVTVAWKLATAMGNEPDVQVTFGNSIGPISTVRAMPRHGALTRAKLVDMFSPIVTVVPDELLDAAVFTAPESAPSLAPDMFAATPNEPDAASEAQAPSPLQEAEPTADSAQSPVGEPRETPAAEHIAEARPDEPMPWGVPDAPPLPFDAALSDPTVVVPLESSEDAPTHIPAPRQDDVFLWGREEADIEAPFGIKYATGIFVQTPWSVARQQAIAQTLRDMMNSNGGWHRHIMAMKVLSAQQIHADSAGPDQAQIAAAFSGVQKNITHALGRPRLQMYLRRFYPNADWVRSLDDEKLGIAIEDFLGVADPFLTTAEAPIQAGIISGPVKKQTAVEPGENIALWAYGILPSFIPTVASDMALGAHLQSYSNLCRDFFQDLHKTNDAEVYETLANATNAALDDRLLELIAHFENTESEVAA